MPLRENSLQPVAHDLADRQPLSAADLAGVGFRVEMVSFDGEVLTLIVARPVSV